MSKQSQLDQIAERIIKDEVTPDLAKGATQLVLGEGSPDAEVMFIGEAPGAEEDRQGLPFVGAAGKFLNEMLASVGWSREDVYITNIVKYRPPDNRDPEPDEIKAFLPYLRAQIEVIRPKVIATLGRFSMSIFLPGARISQIHGQPKKIKIQGSGSNNEGDKTLEIVIMPLYHPAAALYNGSMRETLLADFARLPKVIAKLGSKTQSTQSTKSKQEKTSL